MTTRRSLLAAVLAAAGTVSLAGAAPAQEKITLAIGQKGFWDSMVVPYGVEAGIFKKHGLEVSIVWTRGGSETLQAALSGSADYALTNGTVGVLAAYAKGAPVRIVSSQSRGAGDVFFYVKADSTLKTLKDAAGKTMGFSRPGSSTNAIALALTKQYGVAAKLVPAGGPSDTRTQVMSGQIDIGWSVPPLALDLVKSGQARILVRGSELKDLENVSVRVNVTTKSFLEKRPKVAEAFMKAYAETVEWMYDHPDKTLAWFARDNKVSIEVARETMTFYGKQRLTPFPISGLDHEIAEAVQYKRLPKPLTDAQIKELVVGPMK
ncbi:MAG: ABC transporter substrate-binding protein [Rhodospirillaceae bacterium]|nr:ABC transporter substrate-binding protein [Rhodospirillaceae bacterium]